MRFHPGEIVEVNSLDKIICTLDENYELEGLPFMPEMRKYCGMRLRVLGRVNRMIVEGIGVRFIKSVVVLEGSTCSGEAHQGCERTCFALWKEAWLNKAQNEAPETDLNIYASRDCTSGLPSHNSNCQSASLIKASSSLPVWDLRKFLPLTGLRELRSLIISLRLEILHLLTGPGLIGMSTSMRRTPTLELKLQPGEIVEVRSKDEIAATLDYAGRNRGLGFTAEMEKYCGKRMKVLRRVNKMVVEKTGTIRHIANTVLLDGAHCDGQSHRACPRNCYCLFREIWLRRVDARSSD